MQLSARLPADDVAALVKLAGEHALLQTIARSFEDAESIGLIAAVVAHDARNALVPVVYAADVLRSQSPPPAAELARIVEEGCHRVASILRRITAGDRRGPVIALDVNTILSELTGTLHAMVSEQTQLKMRLESPLPAVLLERSDLERMVLNLVANAREAIGPGGRVVLATSSRTVTSAIEGAPPPGEWIVIEVEDDGRGMDAATRERALQPYFTTKPTSPGSGLGLPSVVRATRAAGGHLVVESTAGQGTKAAIWLPPADATT
jgi:signal transduction histidine kinase